MSSVKGLRIFLFIFVPLLTLARENLALHVATGGFASIPDDPLIRTEQFTIEVWIKRDSKIISSEPEYPILSKSGISIRALGNSFPHGIIFSLEGDSGADLFSGNFIWPERWYHIAVTYDGSTAVLYLNGVVHDSASASWSYPDGYGSLNVGKWISSHFLGSIDELRFWNVARSQQQIQQTMHFLPSTERTGLAGYWKFDDNSMVVADSSGNNLDGMLQGAADFQEDDTPVYPVLVPKPNNVHIISSGTTVRLSWEPVITSKLLGYNIHRSTRFDFAPDSMNKIAFVNIPDSSFEQSLSINDAYYYQVVAVDSNNNRSNPGTSAYIKIAEKPDSICILSPYYLWNDTSGVTWSKGYLRQFLIPAQEPALGEYTVYDSTIIKQHIQWAQNYGIDVWMVDWPGENSPGNRALKSMILPQLSKSKVRFCIQYDAKKLLLVDDDKIDFNRDNLELFEQHLTYLAVNYFNHPSYYHYNGRPVVFIRSSKLMHINTATAIEQVRSAVTSLGYNLFLIGDEIRYQDLHTVTEADSSRIQLFDAISRYSTHRNDNHTAALFNENITKLATSYARYQNLIVASSVKMIPCAITGYNDRGSIPSETSGITPWYAGHYANNPLSTLELQLRTTFPFIDPDLKMLMVTSFNGFHEDDQLEPVAPSYFAGSDASGMGIYSGMFAYRGRGNESLSILKNIIDPDSYQPVSFDEKVNVAVYYYQWYGLGWGFHWKPYPSYLGQTLDIPFYPALGEYDSDNPETIQQHIEWSEKYGIDTWIMVYPYFSDLHEPTEAILQELKGHNITFSFLHSFGLESNNCDNSTTLQMVKNQVENIADEYFDHPNYWKIDGKPVLVFYLANNYSGDCSSLIDDLREYILNVKGYEMYLFGDVMSEIVDPEKVQPWDGYTGYVAAPASGYPDLGTFSPSTINSFGNVWEYLDYSWWTYSREASLNQVDFMANIGPGYNDRAVRPEKIPTVDDPLILAVQTHPDASYTSTFEKMIDVATPLLHKERPMIVINSFNEWHEGSNIEPTSVTEATNQDTSGTGTFYTQGFSYKGYGMAYLDIIKDRFGVREVTDIEATGHPPLMFDLKQNYPNPFNPKTTIRYTIGSQHAVSVQVDLSIYNILGQKVARLVNKKQTSGNYSVQWDASTFASGIYFYSLSAGTSRVTRKLLFLK